LVKEIQLSGPPRCRLVARIRKRTEQRPRRISRHVSMKTSENLAPAQTAAQFLASFRLPRCLVATIKSELAIHKIKVEEREPGQGEFDQGVLKIH